MNSKNNHQMNGLTRKDIHNYLQSKDEVEKQAIEKKALVSAFDTDALDGFSSNNGSVNDLKELDNKFLPKSNVPLWSTVAISTTLIIGVFIYFNYPNEPQKTTQAVGKITEITEVVLPDSIATLIIQPTKELAQLKKSSQEKKVTESNNSETAKEVKRELIPIASIPILKPDLQKTDLKSPKIQAKEIYLNDFKLIDYREYRSKTTMDVEGIKLSGTPADLEKQTSMEDEEEKLSLSIPYHNYIKKTMGYLKDSHFKQVAARCNTILSIYPDDLNAQFYAGIAYYNLGEFQKSIHLFIQCINAPMSNFSEEAEWMLANSYDKNGEPQKAKAIYQLIKQNGGYYSNKVPR